MEDKQEEKIEMLPCTSQSGQNEATIQKLRYQRSLSYRNHGTRRLKKKRTINPSSLRGIDAKSDEEKILLNQFVGAIKSGDKSHTQELIKNNDLLTLLKLRFRTDIRARKSEHRYLETGDYIPSELQMVTIDVTLLQLAVVLEEKDIVQLIVQLAIQDKENPSITLYEMIGASETIVHFGEEGTKYRDLDQMLHETTAFHLAARFHSASLEIFIDHAKDHEVVMEDLKGGRSPIDSSALHYAACNPDPECTRHVHVF